MRSLGEGFQGVRAPSEMSRSTGAPRRLGAQEKGLGVQKLQKRVLRVQSPGQEASTYGSPWRGRLRVREAQARGFKGPRGPGEGFKGPGTPEEGEGEAGAPEEEFRVLEPTARSFGGTGVSKAES